MRCCHHGMVVPTSYSQIIVYTPWLYSKYNKDTIHLPIIQSEYFYVQTTTTYIIKERCTCTCRAPIQKERTKTNMMQRLLQQQSKTSSSSSSLSSSAPQYWGGHGRRQFSCLVSYRRCDIVRCNGGRRSGSCSDSSYDRTGNKTTIRTTTKTRLPVCCTSIGCTSRISHICRRNTSFCWHDNDDCSSCNNGRYKNDNDDSYLHRYNKSKSRHFDDELNLNHGTAGSYHFYTKTVTTGSPWIEQRQWQRQRQRQGRQQHLGMIIIRSFSASKTATNTTSTITLESLKQQYSTEKSGIANDDDDDDGRWFNVTESIVSKMNKHLHLQPYHPLNRIHRRIVRHFQRRQEQQQQLKQQEQHEPIVPLRVFDSLSPIVTVQENFDSLMIPTNHVSRALSDTYYINSSTLLRCHTSAHQVSLLRSGYNNFLITGDVYRRDEIDRTHYPVFHQMERISILLSFKNNVLDLFFLVIF
jgi:tRNA synthetases class II core domain (F)